jgi:DNA-binding GntR family transcriptional regulator
MEQSSREHFAMVEAIAAHQPARLQKLLREHIQQTESAELAAPPTRLRRKVG